MLRPLNRILILSLLLLPFPSVAVCDTINLGLVSFDVFIPGDINTPGVNVFNINNFTGTFALPPDFPVLDSLTFLNSSLTLTSGGSPLVIPLGDLSPGSLNPTDPVQFPDTSLIIGAIFSATLSQTSFLLSDGSTFVAGSSAIQAEMLPSSGSSLAAGTDFVVVAVSNVPEPATAPLLGTALAILIAFKKRNRA